MGGVGEEEGRWGGGEERGGRGIRMNHGAVPWGGFHFVSVTTYHLSGFMDLTLR